jgi:hypothetical protein
MLVLGLVLNTVGIGLFCWLIFTLAVYALPFFIGLGVGLAAFHAGAGVLGALLAGIAGAALTLAIGQLSVAMATSRIFRIVVAAMFVVPAAVAGYQLALGILQLGSQSLLWRESLACLGAVLVGATAWTRMTALTVQSPIEPGRAVGNEPPPGLAGAPHRA